MKHLYFIFTILFCIVSNAQHNFNTKNTLSSYQEYSELPREVAYLHLNKSTYIKGEEIGFSAYILDKNNKTLSEKTNNLYCVILDENQKIIKQKMIFVNQGIARGSFSVDSTFQNGNHSLIAYTNWMNNFKENNFFSQEIKIIDPNTSTAKKENSNIANTIDIQILPESGHFIYNAINTAGVILKNTNGKGIPNAQGYIINEQRDTINSLKTNHLGITKFTFTPQNNHNYKAIFNINNKEHAYLIENIENTGVNLSLQNAKSKIILSFKTNTTTLPSIKNKFFNLAIHNGKDYKELDILFDDATTVNKVISLKDLSPGINIFTLFDEQNNPILERLYFNHEGITLKESSKISHNIVKDSIAIQLDYKDINLKAANNISISVLPKETKSYNYKETIASYLLVKPYINSSIENPSYYFSEVTPKKIYDLDNLLITQGWSSYDWNTIFNNPPDYNYNFENGISFSVRNNDPTIKNLLLYPNDYSKSEIINLNSGESIFERNNFFLFEEEKIRIGKVKANGKVAKPNLTVNFYPSSIPPLQISLKNNFSSEQQSKLFLNTNNIIDFEETEKLDEVFIIKKKKYSKIEKIKNTSLGKIEEFDEKKKRFYRYFGNYINTQGFIVDESPSYQAQNDRTVFFRISNRNPIFPNNTIPTIYLDNVLLTTFDILQNFKLDIVDYIEINKTGLGSGIKGGAGVIKIFTDPYKSNSYSSKTKKAYREYQVPLTFSTPKRFYIPKYKSYEDNLFKEYGVIDWLPLLSIDEKGLVNFKILNTKLPSIKLFIQGIINDKTFISEVKVLNINQSN